MYSDRQLPYQEKHVAQQVSIIGNMEVFWIIKKPEEPSVSSVHEEGMESGGRHRDEGESPAVIEFGAGRGYLTHMLADCYEMKKIILVERRSYKLKVSISLFLPLLFQIYDLSLRLVL